ncbi:MAG: spore maturation protein [Firmicutes bacterium]|nr:spore maturation protein [Bacillota bacterium]
MINWIWFMLLASGIALAAYNNDAALVTDAILDAAADAVTLIIGLLGLISFWSGLMEIAEKSALTKLFAKLLRPLTGRLFPDIPPDHPAMGAVILSITANILGMGNAATPLGIRAMEKLDELNREPGTATDAMCTFVAVTTSSLTVIPITVIALRAAAGSKDPARIIGPTLAASAISTLTAIITDSAWRRRISKRR